MNANSVDWVLIAFSGDHHSSYWTATGTVIPHQAADRPCKFFRPAL
jgi:hypothetical protein